MSKTLRILVAAWMVSALSMSTTAWAVFMPKLPPEQFDYPARNMTVWHYSPAQVANLCGRLLRMAHRDVSNGIVHGCAVGGMQKCILIMPERTQVTEVSYGRLFRHEQAHCNGWRHH